MENGESIPDEASNDDEIGEPPADVESWSDDQWLEWLRKTDPEQDVDPVVPPVTAGGRMAHSSGGQIMGQAMIGLANAIYGPRDDDIVIVVEANSDPQKDDPIKVHLHPEDPEQSTVTVNFNTDQDEPVE